MLNARHKVIALIVRLSTQIEYQLEMFRLDSVFSIIFLAHVMKMHVFVSTASEMAVGTYKQILLIHIYGFQFERCIFLFNECST